ncbi:hypothetical protein D9M71_548760 [compost metagenome]
MHQQPGFDQPHLGQIQAFILQHRLRRRRARDRVVDRCATRGQRVIKRLAENGADREIERMLGLIAGSLPLRHPHRAQLVRVITEQRRVQVIRHHAFIEPQFAVIDAQHMPLVQRRRLPVSEEMHLRPATARQHQQQPGQDSHPHHQFLHAGLTHV